MGQQTVWTRRPMDESSITVILATHNGGARLERTLASMTALEDPEGGWGLIVVDNASTDNTPSIIESYKDKLPLTAMKNPVPGKNRSLNLALEKAGGDLIIFTDDDVLVPPNWLKNYVGLAKNHPEFTVFGCRITPDWPSPPPREILEGVSVGDAFAVHDDALKSGEVAPGKIWGPNMAVRGNVFSAGHRFDETIGPAGPNYVPGSESAFNMKLAKAGYRFWFGNQNAVQHQIRPEQLTAKWLKGRAFRLGRGQVHWSMIESKASPAKIGPYPRWYFTALFACSLQWLGGLFGLNAVQRMKAWWRFHTLRGMFFEQRRLNKNR